MCYQYWNDLPIRFETAEQQRELRRKRINAVKLMPGGQDMADLLENCLFEKRCGLATCPICVTRFRMTILPQLMRLLEPFDPKFMTSIVLEEWPMIPPEFEHIEIDGVKANSRARTMAGMHVYDRIDIAKCLRRLRKAIDKVLDEGAYLFGTIEVAQRDRKAVDGTDRLSVHAHLITAGVGENELKKIAKALKENCKCRPGFDVERPVQIDPVRDMRKQLSYCIKYVDYKSSQYKRFDGGVGRRNIPMTSLARGEHVKFMSGFHIRDLVVSKGIKVQQSLAVSVPSRAKYLRESGLREVPSIDVKAALKAVEEWLAVGLG